MSNYEDLIETMARELNGAIRQVQSDNPVIATAGFMRLQELERMTARWRVRRVSRRGLMRAGVGVTFAAMSAGKDD